MSIFTLYCTCPNSDNNKYQISGGSTMSESAARAKFLSAVSELWPAAKGSVREYKQKCKNKNCPRCASGERHPIWEFTCYENGVQRSKHIPRGVIEEVKQALENGRKIEALLVQSGLGYIDELKAK